MGGLLLQGGECYFRDEISTQQLYLKK